MVLMLKQEKIDGFLAASFHRKFVDSGGESVQTTDLGYRVPILMGVINPDVDLGRFRDVIQEMGSINQYLSERLGLKDNASP